VYINLQVTGKVKKKRKAKNNDRLGVVAGKFLFYFAYSSVFIII